MSPPPTGLADLLIGSVLAVVGLAALAVAVLRQRRVETLLAASGVFALLWGVRHFFGSELIYWVGFRESAVRWTTAILTYLIIVPLRAGREVADEVGGTGPILGRFGSAAYEAQTLEVAAGDRLFLYTDGLVEARAANGDQYGDERLRTFLAAQRGGGPEALCDAVLADLGRWTGHPGTALLDDDLTFVVADLG